MSDSVRPHFLLQCIKVKVKVKSLSRVWLLATPWTVAYQAPLSMGFSRQEYWSGVPLPSPAKPNPFQKIDKERILKAARGKKKKSSSRVTAKGILLRLSDIFQHKHFRPKERGVIHLQHSKRKNPTIQYTQPSKRRRDKKLLRQAKIKRVHQY